MRGIKRPKRWRECFVHFGGNYPGIHNAIISQVIEEDTLKELKGSPTLSLMVDESTDISVLKQLVIFGKMLIGGKPRTCFLKITELFDGKAETISTSPSNSFFDIRTSTNMQ